MESEAPSELDVGRRVHGEENVKPQGDTIRRELEHHSVW